MLSSTIFTLALSVASAFAAPAAPAARRTCDVSKATISFPAGQTALTEPSATPSFIGIGVGVQNYTCSTAGTYTTAGAYAELFDVGCLVNTPIYSKISDLAFGAWSKAPPAVTAQTIVNGLASFGAPGVLGQHYFITNPITGSGISPKWDFTSSGKTKGNANAFVVGAKVANIPAPVTAKDVDWLQLSNVQGKLASEVYRVDTRGGQPPASCTPGSNPISVKYTSMYWLMGSTL